MRPRWTVSTAVALLIGLTALAVGTGGASAQSVTLVSNTGQTPTTTVASAEWDQAQAFTTGADSHGYDVTSVEIGFALAASPTLPTYNVDIFATNSSGNPTGNSLGSFTLSGSLATGTNTFTLSGGGSVRLSPSTTYALVVEFITAGGNSGQDAKPQYTTSNNEDSGGASGWSIADTSLRRSASATTWGSPTTQPEEMRISISGSVATGPPALTVYEALEGYFSGRVTLSAVRAALQTSGQTYDERLREVVAAGGLNEIVPDGRTQWGQPGTESWGQVGFPGSSDPSLTCGGKPQPVFQGDDHGEFFWACTGDNQWVPVRRHRPDVDYSRDSELIKPGRPGYNNECLYRDEEGNPAPVFRADFHPQDHANPQLRGKPVRVNGVVQGTTIRGANYDPLAGNCTTRGGP